MSVTLDQWVADFTGIQPKTADLWKAIRWEFEQQGRQPMTVRQMFYRMSSASEVEKTENGYRRVQRCLLEMRRAGAIPYDWIADNTRWQRKPKTYGSLIAAADFWARNYRRALWEEQPIYVEIWIEKDALAGVFYDVTEEYDVPLYVTRGYSSETLVQSAAENLRGIEKPTYIYHFGDFDPSGRDMARDIEQKLRGFGAHFTFTEAAVTQQQVVDMNLPTRPTKKTDTRAKHWTSGDSVELDAIEPAMLRDMVRKVIEQHIDQDTLQMTRQIETEERARVLEMASAMHGESDFGTSTKTPPAKPAPGRSPRYKQGQRVFHAKFGEGLVTASRIDGDDEVVQVSFDKYGVKLLAASFANLIVLDKADE
ncbi:MAG: hypothetical protein ABI700_00785 [Chloroflexota bacterium]